MYLKLCLEFTSNKGREEERVLPYGKVNIDGSWLFSTEWQSCSLSLPLETWQRIPQAYIMSPSWCQNQVFKNNYCVRNHSHHKTCAGVGRVKDNILNSEKQASDSQKCNNIFPSFPNPDLALGANKVLTIGLCHIVWLHILQ